MSDGPAFPVHEDGPPGRALLFLHGFGLNLRTYRNTATLLAERRRLLFPEWLDVEARWDFDAVVDDLAALADRQDQPLTVVGHSFGGGLAVALAGRHPSLVRELVILNSLGLTERWRLTRNALIPGDHLHRMLTHRAAAEFFATVRRSPRVVARAGWEGFLRDGRGDVANVRDSGIVTHVRWSERDLLLDPDDGRRFATELGATFAVVREHEEAGPVDHDWVYRHPHLVLRELEQLGLVPPRRRRAPAV